MRSRVPIRTLSCAEQYRAMAFAQLTYRESLRDIEICLSVHAPKLYHMGFREPVWRSTLADRTTGIRHRTKRSKGCLSRDGMLHMMFKLGQCAEKKWKRLRGFGYLTKVITEVKFKDCVEVTEVDLVAA